MWRRLWTEHAACLLHACCMPSACLQVESTLRSSFIMFGSLRQMHFMKYLSLQKFIAAKFEGSAECLSARGDLGLHSTSCKGPFQVASGSPLWCAESLSADVRLAMKKNTWPALALHTFALSEAVRVSFKDIFNQNQLHASWWYLWVELFRSPRSVSWSNKIITIGIPVYGHAPFLARLEDCLGSHAPQWFALL